jgi:hypothetical protein
LKIGLDLWYQPAKEDYYFIVGLSRRGEVCPQFPDLLPGVAGGQMWIDSFYEEDVRCLCLILMTLSHFSSDRKCISFPLMYYVDILLHRPQLIR